MCIFSFQSTTEWLTEDDDNGDGYDHSQVSVSKNHLKVFNWNILTQSKRFDLV